MALPAMYAGLGVLHFSLNHTDPARHSAFYGVTEKMFGKIVTATGAFCDNFTLPLCTDNVGANDKAFSSSFPYLAAPTN